MKKFLSVFFVALLTMSAWAGELRETTTEIVFNAREDYGTGEVTSRHHFSVVKGPVTMFVGDGEISTSGHYRIYGRSDSSAFNFTSVGAPITKIEFFGLFGYAARRLSLAEGIGGTFTTWDNDGAWEGSEYFIDFIIDMQARFTKIIVTVEGAYLIGDVNKDGYVKIDDVTALIDALLAGEAYVETEHYSPVNATVNQDDVVSIADVTALIDLLLSGNAN